MRKVIIDERAMNPKYYDKMSELLDALIEQRRKGAIDYKEYLAQLLEHAKQARHEGVRHRRTRTGPTTARKRALVDFFFPDEQLADRGRHRRPAHASRTRWVGNPMKEKKVDATRSGKALPDDFDRLDELFDLVKARNEYR